MKATLEFNLPEDQAEFDRVNAADDMCSFIWDFENHIRGLRKNSDTVSTDDLADKWFEMKGDINLDKIYP